MSPSSLQIIPFRPELAEHFKTINMLWIEQYFTPEAADLLVLNDPQTHLIDKGGSVIFAQYEGEIVGTCGLKKWSDSEYELVKMGVLAGFQGLHIGEKLGQAIIKQAKQSHCKRLFLESNRQLVAALNLYKKLGFKEVFFEDSRSPSRTKYQRCDISMELFF